MEKAIGVFPHKIKMIGDDYGYVSGMTDIELIYKAEAGNSKMILSAYVNDGVRSDLFYPYLIDKNANWRDLALLRLIKDLTVENVQTEIDAINNKDSLFN